MWIRRLSITVALGGSFSVCAAAQHPFTADSLRATIRQAAAIAHRIDSLNVLDVPLQSEARGLITAIQQHNAESCQYPQGQPELCAEFDAERHRLDDESLSLQKALKAIDIPRRAARVEFATVMEHMQIAEWAPSLRTEKARVLACIDRIGVSAEMQCLVK